MNLLSFAKLPRQRVMENVCYELKIFVSLLMESDYVHDLIRLAPRVEKY